MKSYPKTRITKAEARKRFAENLPVYFCPVKMSAVGPFSSAALIFGFDYTPTTLNTLDTGLDVDIVLSAWDVAYNNWSYYNTSYEAGYYAAYYKDIS